MMIFTQANPLATITSALVLLQAAQSTLAASIMDRFMAVAHSPDTTQQFSIIPDGIYIPDQLRKINNEYTWNQLYRNRPVTVRCRAPTDFNNQFKFYKDMTTKTSTQHGMDGEKYVLAPWAFSPSQNMHCFVVVTQTAGSLNYYMQTLSRYEKIRMFPKFFKQLLQGINYIHQVGWANLNLNPLNVNVILHPEPMPLIDISVIKNPDPIFDGTVVKLAAPHEPFLLYSPEWINQSKGDPRSMDMWNVGEMLYTVALTDLFDVKERSKHNANIDTLFSSLGMKQPSKNIQSTFRDFLQKFKAYLVKSITDNSASSNNHPALLLNNDNGFFPAASVQQMVPTSFEKLMLPQNIFEVLRASMRVSMQDPYFKNYSQFVLNGFLQLGIFNEFDVDYTNHPKEGALLLTMINQCLALDPSKRLTPEQYLNRMK